jgi:hypothetical protein
MTQVNILRQGSSTEKQTMKDRMDCMHRKLATAMDCFLKTTGNSYNQGQEALDCTG